MILGCAGLFVLHFVVFGRNLGCNEESFPQVKLKKFKESYLVYDLTPTFTSILWLETDSFYAHEIIVFPEESVG